MLQVKDEFSDVVLKGMDCVSLGVKRSSSTVYVPFNLVAKKINILCTFLCILHMHFT